MLAVIIFSYVLTLISLEQWFSKYDSWTRSICVTGEAVRNTNSETYLTPTESETLVLRPRNLFQQALHDFDAHWSLRTMGQARKFQLIWWGQATDTLIISIGCLCGTLAPSSLVIF